MKLLSFESSAVSASVCLTEGENIIAQSFQNCGLTHSRTLLPMAENLLLGCDMNIQDVDAFAVAVGPGSFTGVRIGVATVKGLAMATDKVCAGVSTLEAMAYGIQGVEGDVCPVMDARAGQVYNARFHVSQNGVERICQDRAIKLEALREEIGQTKQLLVGDGAVLCYTTLKEFCTGLQLASPNMRYASGYGVAMVAKKQLENGQGVSASELCECYLRAPQAERERAARIAQMH